MDTLLDSESSARNFSRIWIFCVRVRPVALFSHKDGYFWLAIFCVCVSVQNMAHLNISLPASDHAALTQLAKAFNEPLAPVVRLALEERLQSTNTDPPALPPRSVIVAVPAALHAAVKAAAKAQGMTVRRFALLAVQDLLRSADASVFEK